MANFASNPENFASKINTLDSSHGIWAAIPEITSETTSGNKKKDTYVSKEKFASMLLNPFIDRHW